MTGPWWLVPIFFRSRSFLACPCSFIYPICCLIIWRHWWTSLLCWALEVSLALKALPCADQLRVSIIHCRNWQTILGLNIEFEESRRCQAKPCFAVWGFHPDEWGVLQHLGTSARIVVSDTARQWWHQYSIVHSAVTHCSDAVGGLGVASHLSRWSLTHVAMHTWCQSIGHTRAWGRPYPMYPTWNFLPLIWLFVERDGQLSYDCPCQSRHSNWVRPDAWIWQMWIRKCTKESIPLICAWYDSIKHPHEGPMPDAIWLPYMLLIVHPKAPLCYIFLNHHYQQWIGMSIQG